MAKRGRKPKPTKLKLLAGNPGKRPLNEAEPEPELGVPDCPDWLSVEAKEEWNRVTPELVKMELLALVDRAALTGLCQNWGIWVVTSTLLNSNVDWAAADTRKVVMTSNDAYRNYMRACTEFGLTPSSRSRISVTEDGSKNKSGKSRFFTKTLQIKKN